MSLFTHLEPRAPFGGADEKGGCWWFVSPKSGFGFVLFRETFFSRNKHAPVVLFRETNTRRNPAGAVFVLFGTPPRPVPPLFRRSVDVSTGSLATDL
jgi:hypothetical protein